MVCLPLATGVLELGSTDVIFQTGDSIPRIRALFNLSAAASSWPPHPDAAADPSVLWLTDAPQHAHGESQPVCRCTPQRPRSRPRCLSGSSRAARLSRAPSAGSSTSLISRPTAVPRHRLSSCRRPARS
ncbi:Os10g0506950 [Oryza sativa Japonica Group]|uniref:Os10g0506950 protein n=1 Tax=Oryza sativa subsp. japonica TaxID=39947 RepID=A0A0P0XW15_ORYSJ|nr:Os10g0506950 [Oryza sativa Japonica Group]